jgi:Fur family transcriptional regulator, peroxide stress response regulator
MRLTPQRRAICCYLSQTEAHPTAAMVYEALKPEMPSLSLMTVYNTLNALVEMGAIQAIGQAGDEAVHYDTETEPHVNVICTACRKIVDIPSEKIAALKREIEEKSGYRLHHTKILFEGLCPECQKKLSNNDHEE